MYTLLADLVRPCVKVDVLLVASLLIRSLQDSHGQFKELYLDLLHVC